MKGQIMCMLDRLPEKRYVYTLNIESDGKYIEFPYTCYLEVNGMTYIGFNLKTEDIWQLTPDEVIKKYKMTLSSYDPSLDPQGINRAIFPPQPEETMGW
jgi:hypothetical protein